MGKAIRSTEVVADQPTAASAHTTSDKPLSTARTHTARAEREQVVLDAAVNVFGQRGYAAATLSEIADDAGVTKQSVINYFGSKENLYVSCAHRAGTNLILRFEAVLDNQVSSLDLATSALQALFEGLQERPHDWNVLYDNTVPAHSSADRTARKMRKEIARQGGQGVAAVVIGDSTHLDDSDIAILSKVWTKAVGVLVAWWLDNPANTPAEMVSRSRKLLSVVGGLRFDPE